MSASENLITDIVTRCADRAVLHAGCDQLQYYAQLNVLLCVNFHILSKMHQAGL